MNDASERPYLDDDFIVALNSAADAMNVASDVQATLEAIAAQAQRTLPGIDHVGVSVVSPAGRLMTIVSNHEVVRRLDDLQYALGEGPCVTAVTEDRTVVVENVRHEQRWPAFMREAVPLGLRAQLGIRLFKDESGVGALNMYSLTHDHLDPHLGHLAELFAGHAAHALRHARLSEQLETALKTRSLIGQAIGILMERYDIDEPRAFDYLVRTSTTSNIKLRNVARSVVDERSNRGADACGPVPGL